MKVSIAVAVSGLLAGATAQLTNGLPECAQTCAMDAIPEDCGLDPECICKAKSFIDSITCCVVESCSKDDQEKTIEYAHNICEPAGVDDIPESAVCESSSDSQEETDGVVHGTAVSTGADEPTDGVIHGTAVSTGADSSTDGEVHGTAVSTGMPTGPATMPPNVSATGSATNTGGGSEPTGTGSGTGTGTATGSAPAATTTGGAPALVAQNGAVAAAAAAFAFFI
jgi:hypothetical protein